MNLDGHIHHKKEIKVPAYYDKLTWVERREALKSHAKDQENRCYFCDEDLDGPPPEKVRNKWINTRLFPEEFNYEGIHLHHSHQTGLTIGAVHGLCNAVLWQYHGE